MTSRSSGTSFDWAKHDPRTWEYDVEDKDFDPDQPRDESGKWTSDGAGVLPPPPPGAAAEAPTKFDPGARTEAFSTGKEGAPGKGGQVPESVRQQYPALTKALGDAFKVTGENSRPAQQALAELSKINPDALAALKDRGLQLLEVGGDKGMTQMDDFQNQAGIVPRGWRGSVDPNTGKQHTWDDVAGAVQPDGSQVVAGKGLSGSTSTAIHETAHAFGVLMNWNNDPAVASAHTAMKSDPSWGKDPLNAYFTQPDPAGRQEFLAEAMAVYINDGPEFAAERFGDDIVSYLEPKGIRA